MAPDIHGATDRSEGTKDNQSICENSGKGNDMSAWIVSKAHIDALVSDAARRGFDGPFAWQHDGTWHVLPRDDAARATEVGRMLWNENLRSIHARYPDTIDGGMYPGPIDFTSSSVRKYEYESTRELPEVWTYKALRCYDYQTCEHNEWEQSESFAFCTALSRILTGILGYDEDSETDEGPAGWDDAPWGLEEDHVRDYAEIV
jgi:hypothetical protein